MGRNGGMHLAQSFRLQTLYLTLLFGSLVGAAFELSYGDDTDLTSFVTRPEIKAPILDVIKHSPSSLSEGFIFVAPYARMYQQTPAPAYYQPCQTGAHIYALEGNLVWTEACERQNQDVADFRPILYNGTYYLTAIHADLHSQPTDFVGYGYVLDNSYQPKASVQAPNDVPKFAMYDFKLLPDEWTALHILHREEYTDIANLTGLDNSAHRGGWVVNMGFREVDVASGTVLFEWWALDHLNVAESTAEVKGIRGPPPVSFDFMGANSIDKHHNGDYLLSASQLDAVLRISGQDGSLIWRLGGASSSFKLRGFNFSRQHDARFVDPKDLPDERDRSLEYITLVDNAVDHAAANQTSRITSAALLIGLDIVRMEAIPIRRILRPDGEATLFGGNACLLPNKNFWISWAGDGYATEYDQQNELVMEARFRSDRFTTYRAYKGDFKAEPVEPPTLACFAFGTSLTDVVTVCYVSWNGATEVRQWRFYSASAGVRSSLVGAVAKTGFETRIQIPVQASAIIAEGLDGDGRILGTSPSADVMMVKQWPIEGSSGHDEL